MSKKQKALLVLITILVLVASGYYIYSRYFTRYTFDWVGGQHLGKNDKLQSKLKNGAFAGLKFNDGIPDSFKQGDVINVVVESGDKSYEGKHTIVKRGTGGSAESEEWFNDYLLTIDAKMGDSASGYITKAFF